MRRILFLCLVLLVGLSCERPAGRLAVLMFHHVEADSLVQPNDKPYAVTPEQFADQMAMLVERGFHPVRLSEVERSLAEGTPLPERAVLVTFDDGYVDNFENAFPVLLERGIPAAIFLITDYIGEDDWALDWAQVDSMRATGLVEFASHSAAHERLRDYSPAEATADLQRSKRVLEEHLGTEVASFCYPYGCVGGKEKRELVFEAGYRLDFGVKEGVNRWPWKAGKPLLRIRVGEDVTAGELAAKLEKYLTK